MGEAIDRGRRQLLTAATTLTGAVGVAFAAVPFLASWKPSARAKPVWVVRRTPEMIGRLAAGEALLADPKSENSKQPEYAQNDARAVNPEYFVVLGVCTHLGCAPMSRFEPGDAELTTGNAAWPGGFYCPCHGSKFDLSGRVFRGVPAPTNLEVPPYT